MTKRNNINTTTTKLSNISNFNRKEKNYYPQEQGKAVTSMIKIDVVITTKAITTKIKTGMNKNNNHN